MNPKATVTVVGNGVSGYACARRLAERETPVALVGPGLPCDRPPLTKRALAMGRPPYLATRDELVQRGIDPIDGMACGWDEDARILTIQTAAGEMLEHRCEGDLVWATGVGVRMPDVPGAGLIDCNATPGGFEQVASRLCGPASGSRVVVIGGGLIGCETAAQLAARHHVTLLEQSTRPLGRMHPMLSRAAERGLSDTGVRVLTECEVTAVESTDDGLLVCTGSHVLGADVVLGAAGVCRALPDGVADTALGIAVDERLRVADADRVWACGDIASFPHPRFGRLCVPHWDNALATGKHVADAILGATAPFCRDPYWFSDIGPTRIQVVGNEAAATEWRTVNRLLLGIDAGGRPACVALINEPSRIREARELVATTTTTKEQS